MLTSSFRFPCFPLPVRFLSSAPVPLPATQPAASSFPLFPLPPHSGFPSAPLRFRFLAFPVLPDLVSHAFFPGSRTRLCCSFPFVLPCFAPAAVPQVIPFRISSPGPVPDFRILSSASVLASHYSASVSSFPPSPLLPHSGFRSSRLRSRSLGFPFLSGLISRAFLPGSRTRLPVCFLSSFLASLPQLFHECFPFGLSPSDPLPFVRFSSGSDYSAFCSSFPFLPVSASQWLPQCSALTFAPAVFPVLSSLISHAFLPGSGTQLSVCFLSPFPDSLPTAVPQVLPLRSRPRDFPLPIRFLSSASVPPPATQPSVSSFPHFPAPPHSGFPGAPLRFRFLAFPVLPGLISHAFFPGFRTRLCCSFPFVLPCFAPAAVPQVIPFRISSPGPVPDFRILSSASVLASHYSASVSSFPPSPLLPHSGFRSSRLRSRFPGFPFLSSPISRAFLPGSRTRLSVRFLSPFLASLPQLFHECFPFGLSPSDPLSFVRFSSGSDYSALCSSFPFLPASASQWLPQCPALTFAPAVFPVLSSLISHAFLPGSGTQLSVCFLSPFPDSLPTAVPQVLPLRSRPRDFPLPFRFLSSPSVPPPATQPSASSFPHFPAPPHSGFPGAPLPLTLPRFSPFVPAWFPMPCSRFSYSALCSFPFALPRFAPTAVPRVLPFCFRFRAFPPASRSHSVASVCF